MKKARKERHPPKKVLCPTDVESRERRGFIQLPNSVRLHSPRDMKAKILKGAEERQVEINVIRITAAARSRPRDLHPPAGILPRAGPGQTDAESDLPSGTDAFSDAQ